MLKRLGGWGRGARRDTTGVGLDIGTTAVRAVALNPGPGAPALAGIGIVPLSPDAIVDGAVHDTPRVVAAVADAVTRAGAGARRPTLGLSGRDLMTKTVQLPPIPARQRAGVLALEAEQHIPFPMDEVLFDYHVIREDEGGLELLLVAVRKARVLERVEAVEAAGFTPGVVDLDALALANQYALDPGAHPDEAVALVDIGATATRLVVLHGGTPLVVRDVHSGGHDVTRAIAARLGVSLEEAEAAKLAAGGLSASDRLFEEVDVAARRLGLEIHMTADHVAAAAHVQRIVLAGGGAWLAALAERLEAAVGLPVVVAEPFAGIEVPPGLRETVAAAGPSLAVAAGLALRGPGDSRR